MTDQKTILIIDDEEDFSFFVKRNLERIDYNILVAKDGYQGLELAKEHDPDLVLLDIMMPGISGFKVLEELKKDEKTISIPVIMLTGKEDKESQQKARELFNKDYIIKPVETEELRNRIKKALDN